LQTQSEEAYFIGVLLGRGSIENSDKYISQNKPFGKYVLRVPSFRHTPLGKTIIETLLKYRQGLTSEEIICKSPKLSANPNITVKTVGQFCGVRLKHWHPISLQVSRPLLTRNQGKWKIHYFNLANKYLEEQEKYFERNKRSLDFVLTHLQNTLKDFSVYINIQPPEPGPFNMEYFSIECHMPPVSFTMLNKKYGLSFGDAYKHLKLPKTVKNYSSAEKQEFIRGLADATAHFDKGPYWYGDGKEGLWQVRIALLADSKPELGVQLCHLLQEDLNLPVLSINWIKGDMPEKKEYRGGRERHVILWVANIRKYFPSPFFRNTWKEEFLEQCWQEDKKTLANIVGKRRIITKSILSKCPRTPYQLEYSTACTSYGCHRQKNRVADPTLQAQLNGKLVERDSKHRKKKQS
jgi:hypothetical protein